ncbi:MAG: TIGR04211 family SH3 domain-containing protein, partial [Pseudomonadales bacterium]|nr:TIGR04211 family SH3 domain-containing protein [Pseudomonadales bacterium]
ASIKKISSNAISLDINNRELLQKNEMLKVQIAELQAENARLSDKSNKDWFIRGALAVAIGALLAVILPRFKPKPKNSEWG